MKEKISVLIAFCSMMTWNPVLADDEKPNQVIDDLSIVDFHKETLFIPNVFVKNLDPLFDGLCFAVEMVQNGSANNWKVEHAELVECPPSAAALTDTPEDSSSDSSDDANSKDDESEDQDSEDDTKKDDSIEDDSAADDSKKDDSRGDDSKVDSEDDSPDDEEVLAY